MIVKVVVMIDTELRRGAWLWITFRLVFRTPDVDRPSVFIYFTSAAFPHTHSDPGFARSGVYFVGNK